MQDSEKGKGRRLFSATPLSGGFGFLRRFSLHCRDVQTGDNHAALVIEPYNNPASLRVDGGVVSTGNAVPITTAGDDHKWLKRASMQKLTDVTYHASQPSRTGPRAQACLMTELSDAGGPTRANWQ